LDLFCDQYKIIDDVQDVFRKNGRTGDNMFILNSLIRKVKYEKKTLYTCFIDFAKAFDSIWHRGLWYKLIKLGIAGNTLSCIRSMYENSTAQVKLGNVFQTGKGVLQGNNFNPHLFNLFVNDLHERIRSRENSVALNSTEFSCLLYVDDLVLLASNPKSLQHNINKLNNYCNECHLKVNLKRTKIVTFSNSGRKCKHLFQYDDSVIENV
jgi:hypothetical protein